MAEFKAALPAQIKWAVKDNQFDEEGANPKALSLFIPLQSIEALAAHLRAMAADSEKVKTGSVWDYSNNKAYETQGVYLSAKGKDGEWGPFGNINPALLAAASAPVPVGAGIDIDEEL